jgi:Fic family protein
MTTFKPYKWTPIEDLPQNWESQRNDQIEALMAVWSERRKQMENDKSYIDFLVRLRRQWAIETGVLERLYSLTTGATKTLIEKGLDASYISHQDIDINPKTAMQFINDQHDVLDGLFQFTSGERPLGTSYIKELHAALTKHQFDYDAIDTLGNECKRPLPRGAYKLLPNNVKTNDGLTFEFCPPEHVDSEMEQLVSMHLSHLNLDVPPYIESAWIHHRLTLIHPFVDGNGRVSRCLATLVFLKKNWLPLVITRDDRGEYISSLRKADDGDLSCLVKLFISLENRAIREALSISEQVVYDSKAISQILSSAKSNLIKAQKVKEQKAMDAYKLASTLQSAANSRLQELVLQIRSSINLSGKKRGNNTAVVQSSDKITAGYFHKQVADGAKEMNYYANIALYHSWVNLTIITDIKVGILISLHAMGYTPGIVACSALYYKLPIDDKNAALADAELVNLSNEPFTFTYKEHPSEITSSFQSWLEDRLLIGLEKWSNDIMIAN